MMVRYRPFTESWRNPSEAEPYSPEIAQFAPLAVWGSVRLPAGVAELPPAPRLNCSRVIGDAASRAEPLTVLITRSPRVKFVPAWAAVVAPTAAAVTSNICMIDDCVRVIVTLTVEIPLDGRLSPLIPVRSIRNTYQQNATSG